ncbi:YlbE family protein, partial [Bordetella pertussis]
PAQDHRCVVPLAAILSPSQHVQVVRDAAGRAAPCHAALNGGNRWPIRLGRPETEVAEHLRWLNGPFAEQLRAGCEAGIDLVELADQALAAGDDCHGRTLAGTQALAASLRALGHAPEDGAVADYLAQSPGFFLNLWMAASKCMLSAAEGMAGSSLVTAMGGNGREAGIQLAALPGRWFSRRCGAPRGALEPGLSGAQPLPAIGDSAVVEALGLGAMAMAHSPAQQQALGAYMPEPAAALGAAL